MNRQALDELKQQIPLMGYLQAHDWHPARPLSRGRWMGLCPLHGDHKPSFLVDPNKDLFYCYGCGRGGDVIRFAELYHQVKFPQAVALLRQWRGAEPLLQEAARFYRIQLHRHSEAVAYLYQRGIRSPELIEHMRIGYAPGGCLRGWLTQLGHSLPALRQAGLVTGVGYDAYVHRIVFPLEGNLYGRSLSLAAPPHRFLPGAKGGLYAWEQAQSYPEVILVEGLFDYAVLWQAGFHNVTCSLGTHLNARQFRQLCDGPRTVYLAFDADGNGSGQQAAQSPLTTSPGARHHVLAWSRCPRATIPTASLSRAAMRVSSSRCWRRRNDDLPRGSQALQQPCALPVSHCRTDRPAVRLTGSTSTSTTKPSAAWPTQLCEPTRTSCCTFSAGGRVFTTPTRSPKMLSPNRHCWTMCDSSPARNAS